MPVIKENIRFRSFLNTLASWLDIGVKIIIRFIIDPIMIASLGSYYFGIWQVLNQLNSYLTTVDLKTSTALKWIIARERTTLSNPELKLKASIAFYSNFLTLPVYIIIGLLIIYFSPFVTNANPSDVNLIRNTSTVLVLTYITAQILFIFESILTGMNLTYKRMGIRVLIICIGGISTVTILKLGYGLVELALVDLLIVIITGVTFIHLVKKHVTWFGFIRVKIKQILTYLKFSSWFMLMKIATLFKDSSDLLLINYFLGSEVVTVYTITRYVIYAIFKLFIAGQGAIGNSVSKFFGENKIDRIILYRNNMILITWFFFSICGATVIICNRSFITLWTTNGLFGGSWETFLLVILVLVNSLNSIDTSIITMNLQTKTNTLITSIAGVLSVILSIVLTPLYGVIGQLTALIVSSISLSVMNSIKIKKILGHMNLIKDLYLSRLSLLSIMVFLISVYISERVVVRGWLDLILIAVVVFSSLIGIIWFIGLNKASRDVIKLNIKLLRR